MIKVLVVNESPMLLQMARLHLEKAGFTFIQATTAQQAFDRTYQESPDVIVLDTGLPDKSGWDVCKQISNGAKTKHIHVILCDGNESPEVFERAQNVGAFDFLVKPFNYPLLIQKVQDASQNQYKKSA